MRNTKSFMVVFVTAPKLAVARKLAKAALDKRLIACANIVPALESHYRWQGKLEKATECLMILKTRKDLLGRLEQLIVELHPYDTPELIALPLVAGTARYLDWLHLEARSKK